MNKTMMVVLILFALLIAIGFYVSSRQENGMVFSPTIVSPTPTPSPSVTNSTTTIIVNPNTQGDSRAPYTEVGAATNISSSSARLVGRIDPKGRETTYWFEYSEDALFGSLIGGGETVKTAISTGATSSVASTIGDLDAGTEYFYRLVGRNEFDTTKSAIMSFTTLAR